MAEGIVDRKSNHSVEETVDRLKRILQSRGLTLFALVDHSGEAEKVGLTMPPTRLLIFGSAKAGTPLMLAAPSFAIDLPFKVPVPHAAHWPPCISSNTPHSLPHTHRFPP